VLSGTLGATFLSYPFDEIRRKYLQLRFEKPAV
jgi:hypothetical protein